MKKKPMSRDEFYDRMQALVDEDALGGDTELLHGKADDLLCEALDSLGYEAGTNAFHRLVKWYA